MQINAEQRLYVLPCGGGYSCLGFDVANGNALEIARMLGKPELKPKAAPGTEAHYAEYLAAVSALADSWTDQTFFSYETPDEVRRTLESARHNRTRVRLFYGNTKTGAAWAEENDIVGTVGRSMGPMKIPLLIANAHSHGGGGILTGSIVAIMTAPGCFVYKHPSFNVGQWTTHPAKSPDYTYTVLHNGTAHARFKTSDRASRYIAFMKGERFAK